MRKGLYDLKTEQETERSRLEGLPAVFEHVGTRKFVTEGEEDEIVLEAQFCHHADVDGPDALFDVLPVNRYLFLVFLRQAHCRARKE